MIERCVRKGNVLTSREPGNSDFTANTFISSASRTKGSLASFTSYPYTTDSTMAPAYLEKSLDSTTYTARFEKTHSWICAAKRAGSCNIRFIAIAVRSCCTDWYGRMDCGRKCLSIMRLRSRHAFPYGIRGRVFSWPFILCR